MASFIKPFAPAIFNYISKKVWEHSHNSHVEKMSGRVNILSILADMAKQTSTQNNTTPNPDATKSAGSFFACIIPRLNFGFCANEILEKYFAHYTFNNQIVFLKNTTPPPKSA